MYITQAYYNLSSHWYECTFCQHDWKYMRILSFSLSNCFTWRWVYNLSTPCYLISYHFHQYESNLSTMYIPIDKNDIRIIENDRVLRVIRLVKVERTLRARVTCCWWSCHHRRRCHRYHHHHRRRCCRHRHCHRHLLHCWYCCHRHHYLTCDQSHHFHCFHHLIVKWSGWIKKVKVTYVLTKWDCVHLS